jgi:hypothetical protein
MIYACSRQIRHWFDSRLDCAIQEYVEPLVFSVLHDNDSVVELLESVLFANIRFHDTVSRGRLLNRFGKDFEGHGSSLIYVAYVSHPTRYR